MEAWRGGRKGARIGGFFVYVVKERGKFSGVWDRPTKKEVAPSKRFDTIISFWGF